MAQDSQKPTAAPKGAPKTAQEVVEVTIEDLAHAKERMDHVLDGMIKGRQAEIHAFVETQSKKEYKKGDWKEWNNLLLTALGVPLQSENTARGIVRRFEDYLNRTGSPQPIVVEGKFGPKGLNALAGYLALNYPTGAPNPDSVNPFAKPSDKPAEVEDKPKEKKEEWKEEDIAATYPSGTENEYVYRTKDGRWIDRSGKEVDLKVALPKMGQEVMGYFKVENLDGVTQYIDKTGRVHTGIDPVAKAPDWPDAKAA